jgi:hypothetical protein
MGNPTEGRAVQVGSFTLSPDPDYVKELLSPPSEGFAPVADGRNWTVEAKA